MKWLPSLFKSQAPVAVEAKNYELQVKQTEALQVLATGVKDIASFINDGGLIKLTQSLALSNSANALLNGLTAHDGRNGLDARVLQQNAIEIAEAVMKVHDKFKERLSALAKGEERDPELHNAEDEYLKWKDGNKAS